MFYCHVTNRRLRMNAPNAQCFFVVFFFFFWSEPSKPTRPRTLNTERERETERQRETKQMAWPNYGFEEIC